MAEIEITSTSLIVHVTGFDRILALKSSVTVPLEHVASVEQNAEEASVVFHGLKMPGTGIPGVVTAGSFVRAGDWTFWDVHDPKQAIIFRLNDEHYSRVVVGVDDPDATIKAVQVALAGRSPDDQAKA